MTTIVVLRESVHGIPIETYADRLRDRLPEHEVILARTPAAECDLIGDATVATAKTIRPEVLRAADELELFACSFAGYGHLPMAKLAERGVTVTTASGVHGPNVAEHVIGALLTAVRRFPEGRRRQERREWRHYQADELAGSTVTLVGVGAIGRVIADRLAAFDVEVIGVRNSPAKGAPSGVDEVVGTDRLHDALARSTYLVVACPLTDATRGLIDAAALDVLGPEGVLVNIARGPVVDTDALVETLQANELRWAALDVTDPEPLPPEHPLWGFENVQITPHNAGHTPNYYDRLSDIVAENVRQGTETGDWTGLRNQVAP